MTGHPEAGAPPLDPSPEEGRSWLRRELLGPDYQEADLLQRLLGWLQRVLADGLAVAERTPPLSLFAAMLVLLLLVLAVAWLLGRADRAPWHRPADQPLLDEAGLSAADLRVRAEAAFADARYGDALVDAFRATATGQAERGELDHLPGRTAHEVAQLLAASHPARAEQITSVARGFDLVRYGERPADREQAEGALSLDDALRGARVTSR